MNDINYENLREKLQEEVNNQSDNTFVDINLIRDIRISTTLDQDVMSKIDWMDFGNDLCEFIEKNFYLVYVPFSYSKRHVALTLYSPKCGENNEKEIDNG